MRRTELLNDAVRNFKKKSFVASNLLQVTFIGEAGVDVGGIRREFLDILSQKICDWSVFTGEVGNFNLASHLSSLDQNLPYAAGVAVALILCQGQMPVPIFNAALILHIAGQNHFNIEDIPEVYYQNLLKEVCFTCMYILLVLE